MEDQALQEALDLLDRHFESIEALGSAGKILSAWDRDKTKDEKELSKLELSHPEKLKHAINTAQLSQSSLDGLETRIIRAGRDIDAAIERHNPIVSALEKSSHQLHFLQNAGYIVDLVSTVERFSAMIKQLCFQIAAMADERMSPKLSLEDLCTRVKSCHDPWEKISNIDVFLRPLPCEHLKSHVASRISQLRGSLIQAIHEVYERVYTKVLDWPTPLDEAGLGSAPSSRFSDFRSVFQAVLELQTKIIDSEIFQNQDAAVNTKIWALDWLLDRIRLSFRFSFRGKQATNRIDKPDWHCAFVLQTLRDHTTFLQSLTHLLSSNAVPILFVAQLIRKMIFDFLRIRSDVLNSRDCCRVDADVYFADGLVREVRDKIHADITLILEQKSTLEADALFWLTLNETLEFDRAMRRQLSVNAEDLHGAVGVFTDNPKFLQRWISLEVKCTSGHDFASQLANRLLIQSSVLDSADHLKEVMQSNSAWTRYLMAISLAEDADRVPKNFHTLFTILTTARDRAKEIRSPKDRLYFVEEVVLRLLSDYISDLHLYEGEDFKDISTKQQTEGICAVHNAAHKFATLLGQWIDEDFWIDLQDQAASKTGSSSSELLKDSAESCKRVCKRVVQRLIDQTWKQVSNLLKPYSKKKFTLPPRQELILSTPDATPEPSSELEDPLLLLKQTLGLISNHLAIKPFQKLVPKISQLLANYIFEQIVLKSPANRDGCDQLMADVKHIVSVLACFEPLHSSSPFKHVNEALHLLTLGEAELKEISSKVDRLIKNHQMSDSERAVAISKLCDIHHLTPTQILYVTNK